ncbi:MAG: hypothetical protein ACOYJ1_08300 [Peptococcales bacterium]|jgi:hypothetical protein
MQLKQNVVEDYINGKSLSKLSQETGINIGTLRYSLQKLGIPIRSISEGVNIYLRDKGKDDVQLSSTNQQILIGNLLGDGSLRKLVKRALYTHTDKNYEYVEWLKNEFKKDNITFQEVRQSENKCFALESHVFSCFNDFYDLFYPNRKRVVPENIELTPLVLRQWYISDGSVCSHKGLKLAKMEYNKSLLEQLRKHIGQECTRQLESYYIPKSLRFAFIDYIGECPTKCYEYKWDI